MSAPAILQMTTWTNKTSHLLESSCFLKAEPRIGLIRYGNVFFIHTAMRTIEGTIISRRGELDALRIAFATVFASRDVGEYFGILVNDG